jgi:hypothetical protein
MAGLVGLVETGTCVVVSVLDAAVLPDGRDRHRLERPPTDPTPGPVADPAPEPVADPTVAERENS